MEISRDASSALFAPTDDGGLIADPATGGPWDPTLMHGGAPSALVAGALAAAGDDGGSETSITRLTVEFLTGVPIGPVTVEASVVKPGRSFQLAEATLEAAGRPVLLARAVRLRVDETAGGGASPAPEGEPLLPPSEGEPLPRFPGAPDEMFYPSAMEIRHVRGTLGSGAVGAWLRLTRDVLPGVDPTPMQRVAAAADFTNGLSWILPWDEWMFVNTELTIHLHRDPVGEWIGVEARSDISPSGTGLASGRLHDEQGPIGTCAQSLFVSRR